MGRHVVGELYIRGDYLNSKSILRQLLEEGNVSKTDHTYDSVE